jgi:hypothetical protein
MKIAHLFEADVKISTQSEIYRTIQEFDNIFTDGIDPRLFSVDKATGRLNYDGSIEFPKESYVDNTGKLPFSFGKISGDFVLAGPYTDKLKDLSNLPTHVIGDLKIFSHLPKPAEFFRHFPKTVNRLDLTAMVLHDCDFGIEQCNIFSIESFTHIYSLKGSPSKVRRYEINCSSYLVKSFEGISPDIQSLEIWVERGHYKDFDFADLPKALGSVEKISLNIESVKEGYPMLSFFNVKNLRSIETNLAGAADSMFDILNRHLFDGAVFDCQEELLDSKFSGFAKVK